MEGNRVRSDSFFVNSSFFRESIELNCFVILILYFCAEKQKAGIQKIIVKMVEVALFNVILYSYIFFSSDLSFCAKY